MRRMILVIALVAAMAVAYGLGRRYPQSQSDEKTGRKVLYYVDPMHPAYKSDKPGIAPDCGMPLEPVYAEDAGRPSAALSLAQLPAGAVSIDGAMQQSLGIRLARVERSGSTRTIRVVGRVAPEDTRIYRVNSGLDGFVRETYNDSVGLLVKKDQKLATYYGQEILAVASGFLAATERVPGSVGGDGSRTVPFPGAVNKQGVSSTQGYMDRLRNLGMSDVQIARVASTHQMPDSVDAVAPVDGFILARNITPGQHIERNEEFYRIADLSQVWVIAEVFQQEVAYLSPGGPARITLRDRGSQLAARITDSLPQSEAGGSTVKLRLEADNPSFVLRPEMLVDVELPVRLSATLTVPLDAVVDTGSRAHVYVEQREGIFEPREVETGWRSDEKVEILRGLRPGERVVVAATFLVDSESRMKAPASDPAPAGASQRPAGEAERRAAAGTVKDPNCGMAVDPAKAAAAGNVYTYRGATYYFCSRQCKETFQKDPAGLLSKRQGDRDD